MDEERVDSPEQIQDEEQLEAAVDRMIELRINEWNAHKKSEAAYEAEYEYTCSLQGGDELSRVVKLLVEFGVMNANIQRVCRILYQDGVFARYSEADAES